MNVSYIYSLTVSKNLQFHERNKTLQTKHASYIVFLSVKSETNNYIK